MLAFLPARQKTRRFILYALGFIVIVCLLRAFKSPPASTFSGLPDSGHDITSSPETADLKTGLNQDGPVVDTARPEHPAQPPQDNTNPRSRVTAQLKKWLSWDPPKISDHYPPYDQYATRDYDPNRWEGFEQNTAMYNNATLSHMTSQPISRSPYMPYPKYNSKQWLEQSGGAEYVACDGPRGWVLEESSDDLVWAYNGVPQGFPPPDVGSYEAVGLDASVCFDRFGRLGPYNVDAQGIIDFAGDPAGRSAGFMTKANWGQLQNECLARNGNRYKKSGATVMRPGKRMPALSSADQRWLQGLPSTRENAKSARAPKKTAFQERTAILIRTWDSYDYQENDIQAIRSLITELSLLSGGEYQVFLFVNVKKPDDADAEIPVWDNNDAYMSVLQRVPEELRSIAILWNEEVCAEWYQATEEHSVYFQQFMPVQWFSKTHPEFEYIWNWEMDARYIGQHYHFLSQITKFAREQPRKYLWERNSRYYFPEAHGTYANFTKSTNDIAERSPHIKSVWGPQPWSNEQIPLGPQPPSSEAADNFKWGVGEEADFITLLPLWDPRETWWSYHDKLWGYSEADATSSDRLFPKIPRRVFINTLVRFSAQLLHAMHLENIAGRSMASEMWPGSVALQHGFKAVYAPHPIWMSHKWPEDYLDLVFNAEGWGAGSLPGGGIDDGRGVAYDASREARGQAQLGVGPNGEGKLGRWSQERDSPYNPDREHNFAGWSWYFWSDFPKVIYWRWLGWTAKFQIVTVEGTFDNDDTAEAGGPEYEAKNGRLCLPGMLLHPVKNVKPPGSIGGLAG